jgi:hypothetical protein
MCRVWWRVTMAAEVRGGPTASVRQSMAAERTSLSRPSRHRLYQADSEGTACAPSCSRQCVRGRACVRAHEHVCPREQCATTMSGREGMAWWGVLLSRECRRWTGTTRSWCPLLRGTASNTSTDTARAPRAPPILPCPARHAKQSTRSIQRCNWPAVVCARVYVCVCVSSPSQSTERRCMGAKDPRRRTSASTQKIPSNQQNTVCADLRVEGNRSHKRNKH